MPIRVSASIAKAENRSRTLNRKRLGALPTATGGISRLAYARAQAAGIEMPPLLRKAGLTSQQIRDSDSRVKVDHQIRFLNLAAAALRDEFLGFHLAQSSDLRVLGLLYYVPASSEILGEALQRLARYVAMANEGLFLEYHEGRDIKLKLGYVGVSRYSDRHQIEFCLTVLIRLCRQLTGGHLTLARVRVAHHRGSNSSEFAAFFRSDVKFGATVDEIAFALPVKHLPVVSADPYLNKLLVKICEEAISHRQVSKNPFRSTVENAIAPLLPHGKMRACEIARSLGLSPRTFARRLADERLTFLTVLKELRRDLARQYLADPGLSISQIAWLLGYQEPSAFTHAFRRWTGKPPREGRLQRE